MITIPGPSYFTRNEEPALVAEIVAKALDRASSAQDERDSDRRNG